MTDKMPFEVTFCTPDSYNLHSEDCAVFVQIEKRHFNNAKDFYQAVISDETIRQEIFSYFQQVPVYDGAARKLSTDEFFSMMEGYFGDLKEPFVVRESEFVTCEVLHQNFACDELLILVESTDYYLLVAWVSDG